ncbi:MAG: tRNA pseudouridine(55) synthase TruB [Deltaproteobacteria bacterium]|nr:tRNA pseudouridine(55) synthase TruB [Deltaproteobacteria bacterium]
MNGVIVIDKPAGATSRAVVEEVKRSLGIKKAGHTGTLDPLATGVLPVCVDEATKLVQFLALDTKDYRATLRLGIRTDTLDTEGKVITREEPHVTRRQVEEALCSLAGRREQTPPLYSAVKFKGRPLYHWTRLGITVEQAPRKVEIFAIGLEAFRLPEVDFTVSCSKGTYIRSLCAEAGEILGCGGCMSALRRTRSGVFKEEMALSLEGLGEEEKRGLMTANLTPLVEVLPGIASIDVDSPLAERLRSGYQPEGEALMRYHIPFLAEGDVVKFTLEGKRLVALARMLRASGELASAEGPKQAVKILRVFND